MADNRLKSLADRIERLMDERDGIQADIRDIYAEAKSAGYVPKVLRKAITRKRMDPDKRSEEDTILDLYEDALSPSMRRAVEMAKGGASARQIETETGIDQATVARSVSLNKKSETPQPEDGDDGITESCGDAGSASATHNSHHVGHAEGAVAAPPASPHDTTVTKAVTACVDGNECLDVRCDMEGCRLAATQFEAPATPSVGAVASESERVASSSSDDDLTIPAHLRGPSPANRRAV